MRWILDAIAVLTLAGLIAAVVVHQRTRNEREAQIGQAINELRRLELEIKYRAVTEGAALNELGWPITVDPKWFESSPPRNPLVSPGRVWVEVAGEADAMLLHPTIRMTVDDELAGFWYNPYQGIVRARVPMMVSDTDSTKLYNRINSASLSSLLETDTPRRARAGEESGKTAGHVSTAPVTTRKTGDRRTSKAGGR